MLFAGKTGKSFSVNLLEKLQIWSLNRSGKIDKLWRVLGGDEREG